MNNNDFINKLGLILQAISLEILFQDYNNTDLMQELLKLLKERSENNGRKNNN